MSEVRYIQLADAGRVAEIQVNAWKTSYVGMIPQPVLDEFNLKDRTSAWEDIIEHSKISETLVLEDPHIMGWVGYGKCRDEDKNAETTQELFGIYVDPTQHRKGYGQQLWQTAEQNMLRNHPREISLWVLEKNHRARAFYESNGFEADGVSKAPDWLQGAVEIRMILKIK